MHDWQNLEKNLFYDTVAFVDSDDESDNQQPVFYKDSEDEEIIMKNPVQAQPTESQQDENDSLCNICFMQTHGLKLVAHVLSAVTRLTDVSENSLESHGMITHQNQNVLVVPMSKKN